MTRPPSASPSTPNMGAASVPRNCSDPNAVSSSTEPVLTITYQPRISVSISNAHCVRRSAGHWKRKLRTRNAARSTQTTRDSIACTSSLESDRPRLARSCVMCSASDVPVSGSIPMSWEKRNTI